MARKTVAKKKTTASQKVIKKVSFKKKYQRLLQRSRLFLIRRPHRSFRRTHRRDYSRSLKLPGYWQFTNDVRMLLWQQKKLFIWVVVVYGALTALFVGLASQDTYTTLSDTLRGTSGDIFSGSWGEVGQAGLLLLTGVTGSFTVAPTETQQIYGIIFGLLVWLTTVWLLRGVMAGQKPRFRDGLYNAGAPIVSSFLVLAILAVQLLPMALAVIGFSAATASGFLAGGVEAMMFFVVAILLIVLSLYWVTSTLLALVVVTLPGMYPLRAMKTAGDLVIGRRLRILLRLLWMVLITALIWIVSMVPTILLDTWLKSFLPGIAWLPLVPVALLVVGSFSVVWSASYVYLFYRKVVEDDAQPA